MKKYWGHHLMLDCGECDILAMQNKDHIEKWIKSLVIDIDMEPIGEPWIAQVEIDKPERTGHVAMQAIVSSHISAHFVDSAKQIYLDVFSCRKFDKETVKQSMIKYFDVGAIREYSITRQAD
jgi:S-adenosylmethionine/arginine decarboxylase-like enzyme